MLTVAVVAVGIFGVAVVLPLVLVRRLLPVVLLADELEEYRQELLGLRSSPRQEAEHSPVARHHLAPRAAQHGSSAA
ncbi:MAG TPA: hypothetical protein VN764_01380 [Polyangiaceae bacterium]|nr:hypothetical protein [Polyangiaceae bacterium]